MSVEFFQRIAFRLARAGIVCALVVGLLSASIQVVLDLRSETRRIEGRVQDIYQNAANSARLAVAQSNGMLAADLVTHLSQQTYLSRIHLYDSDFNTLASYEQAESARWLARQLSQLVQEENSLFRFPLLNDQGQVTGYLHLQVNNSLAMEPFVGRALYVLLSGLFWYGTLAALLLWVSNRIITTPMESVAGRIAAVNPDRPGVNAVAHVPGHEHDELGHIVNATNAFIKAVEDKHSGLLEHQQQIHLILDNSPNQIAAVNRYNTLVFVNNEMADFFGMAASELIGQNYIALHARIEPEQAELIKEEIASVRRAGRNRVFHKNRVTDPAGNDRVMQVNRAPFMYAGEECVLIIGSDITDLMVAQAGVERLAYFDGLTGLPNRNMLLDRLDMDIKRRRRTATVGVLIFIDIDDFKRINDTLNHAVGDQLLIIIAERMSELIRDTDTLARLGGDEFALSAPDIGQSLAQAETEAGALAERILKQVSRPLELDGTEIIMSASVGVVLYPREAHSADDLLRFADTAMYKAKRLGKNQHCFFRSAMAKEASRLMQLEAELRQAVRHDEFCFFLQPIVDGNSHTLVGAEALIRWQHPERGILAPDSFLGFLENSNMMPAVGQQIFTQICKFIGQTPQRWCAEMRISVNFSSHEFFHADFVLFVERTLIELAVSGDCLEFEITEGAALNNLEEAVTKIERLQRLGITFALDDFGTGFSSLSYLKRLPVDTMKIDKSFIQDVTHDEQDAALVASMLLIAANMGLRVVAEGVELQAQADWLSNHDNVMYQGYLFSRPLSVGEFVPRFFPMSGASPNPIHPKKIV